jgi:hypothetical protein
MFCLWTFFPLDVLHMYMYVSGRFVPTDVWSSGHFVPPYVLSRRMFCPTGRFVPRMLCLGLLCRQTFCLRTFCPARRYVSGRFVSGRFVWAPNFLYRERLSAVDLYLKRKIKIFYVLQLTYIFANVLAILTPSYKDDSAVTTWQILVKSP